MGIPLAFQWWVFNTLTAADTGSILGQETKILQAVRQKNKNIYTVCTSEFTDELGIEKQLNNYSLQRK